MRYDKPAVRGGFLVRPDDTKLRNDFFVPFLFNPRPIETQDQANYSEHAVPGRADPFLQYTSGKAQIINFSLEVEQEKIDEYLTVTEELTVAGREPRRDESTAAFSQPALVNSLPGGSYLPATAREYVELMKSLQYPREDFSSFIKKSPPKLTLVWGRIVINCVMTRIGIVEEEAFEDLELEYAKLAITVQRNDPLAPRMFRGKGLSSASTVLPAGIKEEDIRAVGALRRKLPAGYQFL